MSGQVDWIEAPSPDAVAAIQNRGQKIHFNEQPHVWPWQLSFAEGSPWLDKRVCQAANLCVDRTELPKRLGGMVAVPKGTVPPGHPWWGNPKFDIKHDPEAVKKLMAEAGHSPAKPLKVEVQISASGSGQMQPLPMNEFVQQSLEACGVDLQFDVIEWNTLFTNWLRGAKDPSANGSNAINVSFAAMDPFIAMVRFTSTKTFPPTSNNWCHFGNAEFDKLIGACQPGLTPADDARIPAAPHRPRAADHGRRGAGVLRAGAPGTGRPTGVHPATRCVGRPGRADEELYGFGRSYPGQFAVWVWRALQGDLDTSIAAAGRSRPRC